MNALDVQNKINEYIIENSGWEPTRQYLSISHVSGCPLRAVREYRDGFSIDSNTHRMCFAGYEQEKSIREMLIKTGVITQVGIEVVAPFDARLRGHVDGVSGTTALIEIKSISTRKWEKLIRDNRAFYEHFTQCQLYMLYGGWKETVIVYRNRETYEHKTI